MEWLFLTLIAVSLWAVAYIIDKHILEKYVKNSMVCLIVFGIIQFIFGLVILIKNFALPSFNFLILSLAAGIIYAFAVILYFKALKIEETSRVIAIYNLVPLFVLVFASSFLNETLSLKQYSGIIFLTLGAFLISIKKDFKLRNAKAVAITLGSVIAIAVYNISIKYLLGFSDYWTVFAYTRIGVFLTIIPIIYLYLPELKSTVSKFGKKVLGLMISSETITAVALITLTIAISFNYVSLVSGLTATQPLFVLISITLISLFYPAILKEELRGSIFAVKLISIVLICLGGFLIAW